MKCTQNINLTLALFRLAFFGYMYGRVEGVNFTPSPMILGSTLRRKLKFLWPGGPYKTTFKTKFQVSIFSSSSETILIVRKLAIFDKEVYKYLRLQLVFLDE